MKWSLDFGRRNSRGGLTGGRDASFIANLPFTFLLIVGENVARRTEATRLSRSSRNCSNARIFASRVAAAHASLHARLLARPSLVARKKSGACMSWTHAAGVAHARLGRTHRHGARMSSARV